ncbi:hypothetical protein SAMN05444745_10516 [Arthrobacter sp. OV608]|nr:hypothetical protein SAMN05444745_10516 [Arthrobacter sp. OV608]
MPGVGLELHSKPCKHREPEEACGIRSSPRTVLPDPRARMWTTSTPRFGPAVSVQPKTAPQTKGCGLLCPDSSGSHLNRLLRYWNLPTTHLVERLSRRTTHGAEFSPGLIVLNHAADTLASVDKQKYELLVILICPMIAGRVLRATRCYRADPGNENFPERSGIASDEVFVPAPVLQVALPPLSPAGGPLPERRPQPTTTENTATQG